MKAVARFITRGSGDNGEGTVDLILGAGLKNGILEPNSVYEIREFDGTLTIRKVGAMAGEPKKLWMRDASRVISEGFPHVLLTEEEWQANRK